MTVNWTPFLTLFPLRLPANDMLAKTYGRRGLDFEEGSKTTGANWRRVRLFGLQTPMFPVA
jgi:hypothetical protein